MSKSAGEALTNMCLQPYASEKILRFHDIVSAFGGHKDPKDADRYGCAAVHYIRNTLYYLTVCKHFGKNMSR